MGSRSRSHWGARKAIGGMAAASERVHQRCLEAIAKFDACNTGPEVRAVLDWVTGFDWFLRSQEDSKLMREAFVKARSRAVKETAR